MKFQIVDAFTRQTFGGNPAGVVLLPEGAEFPADETMRKTAAELRYSETAFIKPLGGNRFHIRYTPAAEVELCGHATIGSFHALQEMGLVAEGGTYIDETLSGTLEVVVGKDAILMDMQMPELDGCGAARQIRAMNRPDAKSVPIIAVTANAFAEDIVATTAAGMDAHVAKPIDFSLLLNMLEKFIKNR